MSHQRKPPRIVRPYANVSWPPRGTPFFPPANLGPPQLPTPYYRKGNHILDKPLLLWKRTDTRSLDTWQVPYSPPSLVCWSSYWAESASIRFPVPSTSFMLGPY